MMIACNALPWLNAKAWRGQMQVSVFISEVREGEEPTLLVLPYGPKAAIPKHLQGLRWRNLAVTSTEDKLLGAPEAKLRAELEASGYALVQATG